MDFEISTDVDERLIVIRMGPELNDESLLLLLDSLRAIPDFARFDQLVDFSDVETLRVSAEGLRNYAAKAVDNTNAFDVDPTRRIALAAASDFQFGMTRLYMVHAEPIPAEIGAFRSIEEARAWLRRER